jgi:hypothetical protein
MGGHDQDVLEMCEAVPKAAGKLFGIVSVMTRRSGRHSATIGRALDAADVDDDDPPTDIGQSIVAGKPAAHDPHLGHAGERPASCDSGTTVRAGRRTESRSASTSPSVAAARDKLQISNDGLVSRPALRDRVRRRQVLRARPGLDERHAGERRVS